MCCEGAVDVGALSSLDDSLSSLPYRHRGQTPTPVAAALMPVIAAPAPAARTSRTNLPSTVCRLWVLADPTNGRAYDTTCRLPVY